MLEKEIQQEQNVILQCLRYIVDQNYFGKGEKKDIAITEPVDSVLISDEIRDPDLELEKSDIDQNNKMEDAIEPIEGDISEEMGTDLLE